MTFQSMPNLPWIFPDDAVRMNPFGFRPLKGNTFVAADLPAPGSDYHPSWKREADESVMSRLQTNMIKEMQMLKGPHSIKGKRSRMHGGVVTTTEGKRMLGELLTDRLSQLNAVQSAKFDEMPEQRLAKIEIKKDFYAIDSIFTFLLENLEAGNLQLIPIRIETLVTAILAAATKLPGEKLAQYVQAIDNATLIAENYVSEEQIGAVVYNKKIRALLNSIIKELNGVRDLLEKIASFSNLSPKAREIKVLELSRIVLPNYLSAFKAPSPFDAENEEARQYNEEFGEAVLPPNIEVLNPNPPRAPAGQGRPRRMGRR
jgi:hypothetical protein